MTKKPRLTFEEHTEMGRALADIRNELQTRHVQLANAYPQAGQDAVAARRLQAAFRAVNDARDALETALFREHPEQAETTVYYPHKD